MAGSATSGSANSAIVTVRCGGRRAAVGLRARSGPDGADLVTSSPVYLGGQNPLLGGRSKCEMKAEVAGLTGDSVASVME
jgi:hypothetical protein